MIKLKVCGMRDKNNIEELVKISPHFIGFIFHSSSPRCIHQFPELSLPDHIQKVGVFVNKSVNFIIQKCQSFKINYVQLHGHESPNTCKQLKDNKLKVIKAFNISEDFDFNILKAYENFSDYFLFDAFGKKPGGNNISFNWELLNNYHGDTPFFISGGIHASMTKKIKSFRHKAFTGIDINSGFEISPAFKDIHKIKTFKNELYS